MSLLLFFEGIVVVSFFFSIALTSFFEKERRPVIISLICGLVFPIPFVLPFYLDFQYPDWLSFGLTGMFILPILVFLLPVRIKIRYNYSKPANKFDERDTMFSRNTLKPGTEQFEEYYARYPEKKVLDNKFRRNPGLLKAGTKYYDPILFAAANSIFEKVETLHPRVVGPVAEEILKVDPITISITLKRMIKDWGGHSVAITELKDYHIYCIGGRGDRYGQPFQKDHKYAIVFTVEMDYDMMRAAPLAPTVVESANQYLQSGLIAVQIAEFIRSLGYAARAHIDANYKVICPLVARDAGLGEIGRMGLLITPILGPRVRIAVVTTDIPLITDKHKADLSVIDFCRHCTKCAVVCPGQSIPLGSEKEIHGIRRWQINSESCYTYWCIAGTDCGCCLIVCPYAHPDNWFHRLVRIGIRNSWLFRRLAIPMDDLFYGKRPKPRRV